ncbi:MAG: hypothetical protein ACR652_02365 [Methylocystis sp.]|uniref:hypothetical protein n=1 Tax=Methylocystis sp. TaxID=1911079 RepID=UPI003DA3889E
MAKNAVAARRRAREVGGDCRGATSLRDSPAIGAAPFPKAGAALSPREDAMAGYGLFVLILAVGAATLGYFWMRDD